MGAAASVQLVYRDAIKWFREYFDTQTYIADFEAIDKDHDGAIKVDDLEKWLREKASSEGGAWNHFVHNPQIYAMAHEHASKFMTTNSKLFLVKKKVVDLKEFRSLLVQLFAISILWSHFKHADEFVQAGDAYNRRLNKMEFELGVKSFVAAYGQEDISTEQLLRDFNALDTDKNDSISFNEVCAFCTRFIDPTFGDQFIQKDLESISSTLPSSGSEKTTITPRTNNNINNNNSHNYNGGNTQTDKLIEISNRLYNQNFAFSSEVMEELTSKNFLDELDSSNKLSMKRRSVVPLTKDQANEALNAAMETMVAEVNKNSNVAQLTELKLATELALKEQGIEPSISTIS